MKAEEEHTSTIRPADKGTNSQIQQITEETPLFENDPVIPNNLENVSQFRRMFVVTLCLVTITLEGINMSMPGPFFPRLAKNKGLTQTQIGLVVGSFSCVNVFFSFVVATLLTPKTLKFFFVAGTLWSSVTVSFFGLLSESPSGDVFFYLCLFTRMINGAGASMLYSTTIPMAVRMYPEKASLITTGVQVGVGCGLCLGPPIGSLLIPMGGYKCPFLVIGCTEFVVFTLSWLAIPANRVQSTSTKFRPSDYIRYLCRFSTLSEIVPTAALFCIPGIRDSAYSLFFEDVIGVDKTKVGYLFMFNSADVFISGPIIGFLVEKGMGTIIGVASQIFTLLVAFALYLPHLVPGLETVAWCAMILACNGLIMSSTLNPGYLILEKIAIRQGFTDLEQVKTMSASSFNFALSCGQTFGAFVVGGYINDVVGFYNMCLIYVFLLIVTGTWNITFLFRYGLVGRVYYDTIIEV
ncbi:MFS-type transporter SLC18B1-like [Convolutriloba macropyga]|uniref:MFS-type transporter SLC18B1-like n=1 Tax=Convolutriloba macropyga TaxID=536237 RepID=UPI003F521651